MEEAKEILKHFGIHEKNLKLETLTQGLINETFAVSSNNVRRYVLQRINSDVFPDTEALERNLELVLPVLVREDYTRLKFYRTRSGSLFHIDGEKHVWRLMQYLPQSRAYHNTSDTKVAFEAGRILGVFHCLVAPLDPAELAVPIKRFHDLGWRMEQYEESLEQASEEALERTGAIRDFIAKTFKTLKTFQQLDAPLRVCHNDCKLNNILFSKEVRALCLIDLDTLMPGLFAYDYGDAVRTVANPAAEEEKDLEKIGLSLEMFRSFSEGLSLNRHVLSQDEIAGLPMSIVYMPFMHGLRAFTDYLLGNKYYKVSYPDENLDRARSLFRFSELALEKQQEIIEIIAETLA